MTERGRRMEVRAYLLAQIKEFLNLKGLVFDLLKQSHNQLIDQLLDAVARKADRYYLFYLEKTITKEDFQVGLKQEIRLAWRELHAKKEITDVLKTVPEPERKAAQRIDLLYRYFEPVFLNFEDMLELIDIFHSAEVIAKKESSHAVPILLHQYPRVLRFAYQSPELLRLKLEGLLSSLSDPELLEKIICPMSLENEPEGKPASAAEVKNAVNSALNRRLLEIFNPRA